MDSVARPILDSTIAWSLVHEAAQREHRTVYKSTKLGRRYLIEAVEDRRIIIKRLDQNAQDAILRAGDVTRAIERLNAAGGSVDRQELLPEVAKEVTLVRLHPDLKWSYNDAAIEVIRADEIYPDEIDTTQTFVEGATISVNKNAYERNAVARAKCIAAYGTSCSVCGMNFADRYGAIGEGFIHVHHLRQLADIRQSYSVDPIADLRPVCPNCHAMLHQDRPPIGIEDLKEQIRLRASSELTI